MPDNILRTTLTFNIASEINRYRERLLDLTTSNRLLSYRKSRNRTLQIVDELPDQIHERLVGTSKAFKFDPAPEGLLIKEDPSEELPQGSQDVRSKHSDGRLQTGLSEERLEKILKTIRTDATTSIQETGVNMLYLVLGMLEWFESETSTRSMLAPLLLIPVKLEREFNARLRRWEYLLLHTGEEPQTNLCLAKRLEKDFGLVLPEFDEGQTPEEYFVSVGSTLSRQQRWRVRREALVGFFSFRKLLMYLDLEPKTWGGDETMGRNAVLRQVMMGVADAEGGPQVFVGDYQIDDHVNASSITLALDADSSQHSALCDIYEGKNIVIEGPPGTGKSQTITNAIASMLAAGKTVLFVSEKLAALEVVRHNLERLNLHHFCLDLHSESAAPKKVYEDLSERLAMRFVEPGELDRTRKQLEAARDEIRDYLNACDERIGPLNEPVYEVFWRVIEHRSNGIPFMRQAVISLSLTAQQFQARKSLLTELAQQVIEIGVPQDHPWYGFYADRLFPFNRDDVNETLVKLLHASETLGEKLKILSKPTSIGIEDLFQIAIRLDAKQVDLLDSDTRTDFLTYAAEIQGPLERQLARQLNEALANLAICEPVAKAVSLRKPKDNFESAQRILQICNASLPPAFHSMELRHLQQTATIIENVCRLLHTALDFSNRLQALGHDKVRTLNELQAATDRHRLVVHAAIDAVETLEPELFLARSEVLFSEALDRFSKLSKRQEALTEVFNLHDAPDPAKLQVLRKVLERNIASPVRLLKSEYRSARKDIGIFSKRNIKLKNPELADRLQELEEWLRAKTLLSEEPRLIRCFGGAFKGFESDWKHLENLVRWAKTARQYGIGYEEASKLLRGRSTQPVLEIQELVEFSKTLSAEMSDPVAIIGLGDNGNGNVSPHHFISDLRSRAEKLLDELRALGTLTTEFILQPTTTVTELVDAAKAVIETVELRQSISSDPKFRSLFSGVSDPFSIPPGVLLAVASWTEAVERLKLPSALLQLLFSKNTTCPKNTLHQIFKETHVIFDQWMTWRKQLSNYGGLSIEFISLGNKDSDPFCIEQINKLLKSIDDIQPWAIFCRTMVRANEHGISSFADACCHGEVKPDQLTDCYDRTYHERLALDAMTRHESLRNFSRQRLDHARSEFQRLDKELLDVNRRYTAFKSSCRAVPPGISSGRVSELTQHALIKNEIQKQKRHCKLRDLVRRAGAAVQGLKPCFMMSPLSVAQFLPPDSVHFDVVVMDEASQIKPEDALGTVLRAKQLVVVGDPKQLPPTSFFDRVAADEVSEDEETVLDDTESILEVAMKAFPTVRRLKWHYRSQHESLIAFANERFYDGDLIVFPSPFRKSTNLGVRFHYVDNGRFVGGCNPVEAVQVAKAVVEHAVTNPNESLGVGTFNLLQATSIKDEIDRLCSGNSRMREAIEQLNQSSDSLFIKNLEHLQGDERDVIFISYTYGRDPATDKVLNRFGPINSANGWRRLNVLTTRARRRVEVFSSMRPEEILGGPGRSRGLNSMRDYLEYARGIL